MRHPHKTLVILLLSATAFSLPAAAQDIHPAVQALLDNFERQAHIKPAYEAIETDGNGGVTIRKLTVNKPAEDGAPSVTMRIDEVVLSGISEAGDGLYEIANANFNNLNGDVSGDGFALTFEMPQGSAEGWYVKALGDAPTAEDEIRASMNLARKIQSGKMTFVAMGQSYSVDGYESTWDGDPATGAGDFSMKVVNIAIPEQAIAMVDQGGMLKQLGYGGINLDLQSDGRLDIADGNMGLAFTFGLAARDMGALKFGMNAAGIPVAVYAELQKAQKDGNPPDVNALMPQVQNVSFSGFSVRFEDASITKKVLPMIAAMQGMDETQLIASVGPMLQMGLMQLQNQAFAEKTAAAINGFLKEPKSLTVAAQPATPVKVSDFMTMNPNAPGEIIDRLGLSVSSND